MSRLRACGSLRKLDVADWQERARGAASGAGRLEGMGPAGEQRRGEVELLCL